MNNQSKRYLIDLKDDESSSIHYNPDRKSTEMGLFPGAHVRMLRKRNHERSVVICVDEARFLVSKDIAKSIEIV